MNLLYSLVVSLHCHHVLHYSLLLHVLVPLFTDLCVLSETGCGKTTHSYPTFGTECGIKEDEDGGVAGKSRVVKPHPNFHLFLSMNPAFGEVSRAMRNRCIEVSLLAPSISVRCPLAKN